MFVYSSDIPTVLLAETWYPCMCTSTLNAKQGSCAESFHISNQGQKGRNHHDVLEGSSTNATLGNPKLGTLIVSTHGQFKLGILSFRHMIPSFHRYMREVEGEGKGNGTIQAIGRRAPPFPNTMVHNCAFGKSTPPLSTPPHKLAHQSS